MFNPAAPDFNNTPVSSRRPHYNYKADREDTFAPQVSVITPFYNPGPIFEETIRAIRLQSFQNFEWIIVDDGSTDPESLSLLDNLVRTDERVCVIHQTNQGPAIARNLAFEEARSEYVFQIDTDDLIEPTLIEKCLWFLESRPEHGFCNTYSIGFCELSHLWSRGFDTGKAFLTENQVANAALIRKSVHQDVGGYDETIRYGHEDWDYWLNLASHGYWGATIPEYLFWYRRRSNGRIQETISAPNKHHEFRKFLHKKYPALLNGDFPKTQPDPHLSFAMVSTAQPFHNPIRKPPSEKRILMLVPWLEVGGADAANLDVVGQLSARNHKFTICTTLPSDNHWLAEFARFTPDIFNLHNFLKPVDIPRFLLYLINSRQIDVVFIANSYLGYQLLPFLRAYCPQVTFVDYIHMEEEYWKSGGYPRASMGYRELLDLSIVTTAHLKRWMVERGDDSARIEVCYTNIDAEQWNPDNYSSAKIRAELDINEDVPLILYVGRIVEQKRPRVFAETIRRLAHEERVQFICLVIGEGEKLPFLQEFVQQHYLQSHVRFLGTVPLMRLQLLMAAADIFFLPSKKEGISVALFEALATQTIPVGADVGGQRELVTPECGYLIFHGENEINEYVQVLKRLIELPSERQRIARAGRARIINHFRLDQMTERMVMLLNQAQELSKTKPRPPVGQGLGLETATLAIEYTRLEQLVAKLWSKKVSKAAKPLSPLELPFEAQQILLNSLSGEEMARRIPVRRMIQAIAFKVGNQPGLGWLYRFRHLGKRVLGGK